MKLYTTSKIRNIGLVGHGGTGKTSLAEAMLFHTGANTRIGKVDDDTSLSRICLSISILYQLILNPLNTKYNAPLYFTGRL